jgi:hypothetical protein
MIVDMDPFMRDWAGYFGFGQGHDLPSLDGWIRLRCIAWVQWKTRGHLSRAPAAQGSRKFGQCSYFSPKGPWRLSFSETLHHAFTNARFRRLDLLSMEKLVGT